jgi:peptidoglycan/xylan/chitin deacetylase (PgdA/CDA1 family)
MGVKAALRTLARQALCTVRPRALVLAYHYVGDSSQTAPWVTVSPDSFAAQMAWLAKSGLVISLDCLLGELQRRRVPRGSSVVITFDDAALDTWTTAFPILRRYNLPATLFVPTDCVGRPGQFWWNRLGRLNTAASQRGKHLESFLVGAGFLDEAESDSDAQMWRRFRVLDDAHRQLALERGADWLGEEIDQLSPSTMDWDQIAELDASGLFTLGAHTISHPMLAAVDEERLSAEVAGCGEALSSFNSYRKVFAYPYGDPAAIGPFVRRAVREAGYEAAFTTDEVALTGREDPMALGRLCIDEMSIEEFSWTINEYLLFK